ncbi:MAG: MarR family transcriptional regulator [Bacteroidaceae bacterium]|nr:MarR family transcriptional regulator [Bacteroidaceae bacterium]
MSTENLKLNRQGCFRLYTAARLIIQAYQPWFAKLGITYTQYLVLMVLWEQDAQPLNAIQRRLYLESNTLTPLIKRMETMKLVVRKKNKDDARQTIVALTERGKALQQQAEEIPDCLSAFLKEKGITEEEFQAIIPTLDHLIEALSK